MLAKYGAGSTAVVEVGREPVLEVQVVAVGVAGLADAADLLALEDRLRRR